MLKNTDLFDIARTIASPLFAGHDYPWEIVPVIHDFIQEIGEKLPLSEFLHPSETVWIAKDAVISPTAYIGSNVIIDHEARIGHCAYIRENAIVGKNAVVGNSTELKNVVLFDRVELPHYNYVGDSVLGYKAHLGAGAVISNLRLDKALISVKDGGKCYPTGLQKFGAAIGDCVEVGCNSVLNPGTVIARNSVIYPLTSVRGVVYGK